MNKKRQGLSNQNLSHMNYRMLNNRNESLITNFQRVIYLFDATWPRHFLSQSQYNDVIMSLFASQITSLTIVYSTVYSDADQRKHQSAASLAFVRGIHRGPVNSPHKGPVTRKMFPFDDVIMQCFLALHSVQRNIKSFCEFNVWITICQCHRSA